MDPIAFPAAAKLRGRTGTFRVRVDASLSPWPRDKIKGNNSSKTPDPFSAPFAYRMSDGSKVEDWTMDRHGHGCGGVSASARAIFWRGGNPWMQDLAPGSETRRLTDLARPGCWINIIPASGMVLMPDASPGCTCAYTLQATIGFAPVSGWDRHSATAP